MKLKLLSPLLGILWLLPVLRATATVYYVNAANPAPAAPFSTWATAATNIQDAINVTTNGDTVLVTNGVYAYGGISMDGVLSNRVAISNAITVQSVNGPWVTTIFGASAPNSTIPIRCAWLTNGASLTGFTLTGGWAGSPTSESGGGAWCASTNASINNCLIVMNGGGLHGEGVYQGTIRNSLISSNSGVGAIGASFGSILENCTIVYNSDVGVEVPFAMTNCIVYFNGGGMNYGGGGGSLSHCCATPILPGTGNFTNAPLLLADGIHLATNSPCIGAGTGSALGTDIDGQSWSNPPAVGCDQWQPAPVIISQPSVQFLLAGGVAIGVNLAGLPPYSFWWTKDGAPIQDDGHYSSATTTPLLINNVCLSDMGGYQVVVSNSFGVVTSSVVQLTIHCVGINGASPVAPYSTWATAATNIQDAIAASAAGDLVLVTNGVYAYGGNIMAGDLMNRVAISNAITVRSVNGPWVTTILGAGATNGTTAVRCAWLTNGASLIGFALTGGATRNSGTLATLESGGGVWCVSTNALVGNCVIISNTAQGYGIAAYQGTLVNCLVTSNSANSAIGTTYDCALRNCTVVGNATVGADAPWSMTNCIVYYNSMGDVEAPWTVSHCCVSTPQTGPGNFTTPPLLFPDGVHLASNSPCIGAGINVASGTDIFGNAWSNSPAVGCAEWTPSPLVTTPQIKLTGVPAGFTVGISALSGGPPLAFSWLKDGLPLQDNGPFSGTQTAGLAAAGVTLADAGGYQLVVSNSFGVVTSSVVKLTIHCVDINGANPVAPYFTWATAATNIQDAITASAAGDVVLVTNGVYATGGISMDGVITNRVSVNKAILVQSVNGASATIIQGAWDPAGTNGPGAIRCVWLTTNAILSGFTIEGGATRAVYNGPYQELSGGGVFGATTNSTVASCTITNNAAFEYGGGAYGTTLANCLLIGNDALGFSGAATVLGGGADSCNLSNCVIIGNYAFGEGGGTAFSLLKNCAITGNSAGEAGGVFYGTLVNCTVAGNRALSPSIIGGGGANSASFANSIVYANQEGTASGSASNYYNCTFSYSCSTPVPAGTGNIGVNPQLLGDGVHLAATSPCIGAGNSNVVSGTDIDGQPWSSPPAMGCDEWHPALVLGFGIPLTYQVNALARSITFNVVAAGQMPFTFYWSANGNLIQDNGHYSNSGTANLMVNNFGLNDAGPYQVVVSNSFGVVTSQVAQVAIHAVNAAGANPVAPYSTWATAATNIQDAISIAQPGEIVLVTNGIYDFGGEVVAGDLTNRVALTQPMIVMSVNGYAATVVQGAWDPVSTNGPGAVRCAYIADGAALIGFTLRNGATRSTGGTSLESGAGAYCVSSNGVVSNCVLSNNYAIYGYGGGIINGTLNNSLVIDNGAESGGGAYSATLNNCTVRDNFIVTFSPGGAGIYKTVVNNSIVAYNYDYFSMALDNFIYGMGVLNYSCAFPGEGAFSGIDDISVDPEFLDWFHIASTSPCRGAGGAAYATGTDLDGEPWANPPSMGCDEVITADLVGPLTVVIQANTTNLLVNRYGYFTASYTGRVSQNGWSFGDGTAFTNSGTVGEHEWTSAGDYPVTFTAYNNDNPGGVSATLIVHVQPLNPPQLSIGGIVAGAFQFSYPGQTNVNYTIQYTTNLTSAAWQTFASVFMNQNSTIQVSDPGWTNGTRFYRVLAQ